MKIKEILLSLALLIGLNAGHLSAGEIRLVRSFETWNAGIIKSTDPAGIVYHPPSGSLVISDSEINEIAAIWNCENIFVINLSGNQVIRTFDAYAPGGQPCPPLFQIFRREPTGITYNEFNGLFYITNDDRNQILRYDNAGFGEATAAVVAPNEDVEGITSDPSTGYLYVVAGEGGSKVLVYTSDLDSLTSFSVNDRVGDPEGIAYNAQLNHLFLVSQSDLKVFEYTLSGQFVTDYDISGLLPTPICPQGLTFAPSSNPNDEPNNFNLYIADGQVDNNPDPNLDRDGIIYEVEVFSGKLRINSGGPTYTAINSNVFSADQVYTSGSFGFVGGRTFNFTNAIGGTNDDPLYQDVRFNNEGPFSYRFDVSTSGNYDVSLHLMAPALGVGNFIMDVSAEGVVILDDFDVNTTAGGTFLAHIETFTVNVSDGTLDLDFVTVNKAAIVCAIEVVEQSNAPSLRKETPLLEPIVSDIPREFHLFQNYPNPFNPETEIRFQLPEASRLIVTIFNTLGQEIRTLMDRQYEPGFHSIRWDSKDNYGNPVPSGIYFYQLQAGSFYQVKKMSLLK